MPKTRVKFGYVWTKQRQVMAHDYIMRHCWWRAYAHTGCWSVNQTAAYTKWVREFLRPEHEAKTTQRNRVGTRPPWSLSKPKARKIPARPNAI